MLEFLEKAANSVLAVFGGCLGVLILIGMVAFVHSLLNERGHARRKREQAELFLRRQSVEPAPAPIVPPNDWIGGGTRDAPATPRDTSRGNVAPQQATPTLSLSTFAPLTDAQLRAAASATDLRANLFTFGRSSIIPPVTDPRTLLIDKGMVAHGFITPEELAEIHRIGEQMDQVKPTVETVHRRAQAAVAEARAERQRIKEQKKAAAAERKRLHAEAVARRKATDIVYLGRGVSQGLADRRADVEKLAAAGLPVLATPADVAEALKLTIPRLRWLAFHSEAATRSHYVRFTVPKKSGGTRNLFAPMPELAAAQEWILRNILDNVPTHDAAHGFVRGRSTLTNATPHVGRAVVVNTDLENFFPTITFPRVRGVFRQLGYSPAAATIFALLCTESPRRGATYAGQPFHVATGPRGLPQGACTSPALSNLAARRLDSRLAGIAKKLGYAYTRYADDMTFSFAGEGGASEAKVGYLLARVRHITQDEGFAVNEPKTRVLKPAARQSVTGIVVNERPGVPRPTYKRLRAILHRAKTEGLAAQNREGHPHFEAWVRGMIAYVRMVNPGQGEKLARALEAL
jgi:retron-type reverse transcriptase